MTQPRAGLRCVSSIPHQAVVRCFGVLMALLTFGCETKVPENTVAIEADRADDQQTLEWSFRASSPLRRLESPSVKVNGKLYLFAGFKQELVITDDVGVYDPVADIWTSGAPMPTAVTHMGTALVGSDVWILGGFIGDHPGVATDRVQIYDTVADRWREGPSLPHPRASLAAAFNDGQIHVFGGLKPDRQTDVGEHFTLKLQARQQSWTRQADLPNPRNHLSGLALNGLIYAVGGQFGHDDGRDQTPYVDAFDPETGDWAAVADLPADRSHFEPGTFAFENKIVIVGGQRERGVTDEVTIYDPETNQWSHACNLPRKLLAPAANAFDGQVIVAAGGLRGTERPRDVVLATGLALCIGSNS